MTVTKPNPRMRLSPHFELWEAMYSETATRLGIDNTPSPAQIENLKWTCVHLMEPVRAKFGRIRVTSGYRCLELNARVPGSSNTSAHPDGRAFDFHPYDPKYSLRDVVEWIAASKLPFDQVIYEYGTWIHLGAPMRCATEKARRLVLMKFTGTVYLAYDSRDPRVVA